MSCRTGPPSWSEGAQPCHSFWWALPAKTTMLSPHNLQQGALCMRLQDQMVALGMLAQTKESRTWQGTG